jgi:uncharacterized protein YeaO (DUF488 family)
MPKDIRMWEVAPGERLKELATNKLDLEDRLEQWLEDDITLISEGILVIGRQVETAYGKFIDLLCVDANGDLMVVELKRDMTPRDVVAQALDYGSWVKDLSNEDVTEIADEYFSRKELRFEDAFRQKFGEDLPDTINDEHSMLIVAAGLDPQTERIIEYLSGYHHVGINSLTFQYFKDESGRELIGRVFLIDPDEVQQRAEASTTSKRKKRLTMDELTGIAVENGVGELFEAAVAGLKPIFNGMRRTRSDLNFVGKMDGSKPWIFKILPAESSKEEGLRFQVFHKRLAEFLRLDENKLIGLLPNAEICQPWVGSEEAYRGRFTSVAEIDTLARELLESK